jgi:hypothetical protein
MNNDARLLAEAYQSVLEAKKKLSPAQKKLSPAQKKLASAAPPPDEITGADFKALKNKKKSKVNENEQSPAGWLTEYIGSFKRAFADVTGIGYGGDGISDDQFAAAADQIIGSEWGDEAPKAKEALIYLLKGFYGVGVQDS